LVKKQETGRLRTETIVNCKQTIHLHKPLYEELHHKKPILFGESNKLLSTKRGFNKLKNAIVKQNKHEEKNKKAYFTLLHKNYME